MKPSAYKILGKKIRAVVAKRHPRSPKSQVFLVFDDGSSFEIYSSDGGISFAGHLGGDLDWVRGYMNKLPGDVEEFLERRTGPPEERVRFEWLVN